VYQYAFTDLTALGESLPSSIASVTTGVVVPPSAPIATAVSDNSLGEATGGQTPSVSTYGAPIPFTYKCTFVTAGGETTASVASNTVNNVASTVGGGFCQPIRVALPSSAVAGVTGVNVYRQGGGYGTGNFQLIATNQALGSTYVDELASPVGQPDEPSTNTTLTRQVAVSAIAVGPAGTLHRNLYRTAVNGSQLKYLGTVGGNVTTNAGIDTAADGALAANVPTTDTSGL
jgi:hypothetical protein